MYFLCVSQLLEGLLDCKFKPSSSFYVTMRHCIMFCHFKSITHWESYRIKPHVAIKYCVSHNAWLALIHRTYRTLLYLERPLLVAYTRQRIPYLLDEGSSAWEPLQRLISSVTSSTRNAIGSCTTWLLAARYVRLRVLLGQSYLGGTGNRST